MASVLIKTTFYSTEGAEDGVEGGAENGAVDGAESGAEGKAENGAEYGVEIITNKAGGYARARCYKIPRRPLFLLIK
jgi:hypothetical protein